MRESAPVTDFVQTVAAACRWTRTLTLQGLTTTTRTAVSEHQALHELVSGELPLLTVTAFSAGDSN